MKEYFSANKVCFGNVVLHCSSPYQDHPDQPRKARNHCIIMDEVDGMGGGDRGGMAELIQLIKKTKVLSFVFFLYIKLII
jgi:hypothetical protein